MDGDRFRLSAVLFGEPSKRGDPLLTVEVEDPDPARRSASDTDIVIALAGEELLDLARIGGSVFAPMSVAGVLALGLTGKTAIPRRARSRAASCVVLTEPPPPPA